MKFLILGGTGYLGKKLSSALLDAGNQVICTQRKKTNNLQNNSAGVKWISTDVKEMEKILAEEQVDWVVNLVCNYGRENASYMDVINSNLEFPLQVLDVAACRGVKNFFTVGTGLPSNLNIYSFTKKQFSEFGLYYANVFGLNFVEAKLEMFYGADEPSNRFLPNCVRKLLRNEDINMTEGFQKRDIIAVEDVIQAFQKIFCSHIDGYEEIPVGTGVAPSIREILSFMREDISSKSNLNFGAVPTRAGEVDCIADIAKLTALGYKPQYDWKCGIHKMIREIRENEVIN